MHQTVLEVTERIIHRSRKHRTRYLQNMEEAMVAGPFRHRLPCSNLAHAMAVCQGGGSGANARSALSPYRHHHLL